MLFGRPARPVSPPSAGALCPDDGGNRIDFHVRDLGTRSVRLSPSRAHVTRDINDIHIEPGTNHITIIGLSPTVDEHSIKVEGVGPAFISDIAVQLMPNRDIFEEVYPDSEDDSDNSSATDSDSDDDSDGESDTIIALREELGSLSDEKRAADELIASAEVRLKILDSYSARIANPERPILREGEQAPPEIAVSDGLETYRAEREKAFRDNVGGKAKGRSLDTKIDKLRRMIKREVASVAKSKSKAIKSKEKATKAREKERKRKARKEAEHAKEKLRIRRQREATWPRNVYAVRVTLETAVLTPGSTRRSSVSSDIVPQLVQHDATPDDSSLAPGTCRLTLSYMTTSAFWTPAYDLALSTVTNSASLCFDALLTNHTSEVWSNCKVSLATSQAESYDLTDKLPFLQPWQVKLVSKDDLAPGLTVDEMLLSTKELEHRRRVVFAQRGATDQRSRWEMFGVDQPESAFNNTRAVQAADTSKPSPFAQVSHAPGATGLFGGQQSQVAENKPTTGGLFGSAQPARSGGLFGSSNNAASAAGFGQPASARPESSTFGAAQTTSDAPRPAGSGLSGSSTTPATGAFGSSTQPGGAQASTSLFGAARPCSSSPMAGGGLFGGVNSTATTGGGLFGGGAGASQDPARTETAIGDAAQETATSNTAGVSPRNKTTNQDETFHDASEGSDQRPPALTSSSLFSSASPVLALPMSWGEDSSSFTQMGLTSNHDLPGLKTLSNSAPAPPINTAPPSLFAPSRPSITSNAPSGASRHRVTRITSFTDIEFTRTVVAKYKPAAYLRVKLRNGSKIPILSGMASVTLDGSFLGRMQIPPTSASAAATAPGSLFGGSSANNGGGSLVRPGEYMYLDLGIDPTVRVTYTGPTVRMGKQEGAGAGGYLAGVRGENREIRRVYSRTVTLFNGREHGSVGTTAASRKKKSKKAGADGDDGEEEGPVKVTVLDQIPTTEDERLKIKILKPVGLSRAEGAEKVDVKGSGGVLSFFSSSSASTTAAIRSKDARKDEGSSDSDSDSDSDGDDDGVKDEGADTGDSSWGKAQARMMPSGQVEWDVSLRPSRMVKLVLEYEFVYPKEDGINVVNAD